MFPLQSLHTFGFPVYSQAFRQIDALEQAQSLLSNSASLPVYFLGEGSNTVFLEDFAGTVIKIAIKGIQLSETPDSYQLTVGAGENWHQLILWCLQRQIYGFENLALIPGTVGAAPIQNIGAYGVEIEQFIEKVDYLCLSSFEQRSLTHQQCRFGYRDSIFKGQLAGQFLIGSVTFRLPKQWQANTRYAELAGLQQQSSQALSARQIFDTVVAIRQSKLPDPKKIGNAGSFFKNPVISKTHFDVLQQQFAQLPGYPVDQQTVKIPAAWLIDTLGFKGREVQGIQCHPQQPLVLTNKGSGNGQALLSLAREIKQAVQARFAIELENEVQLVSHQGLVYV